MLALHCLGCSSLRNWRIFVIASDLYCEHLLNPRAVSKIGQSFLRAVDRCNSFGQSTIEVAFER